MRAHVIAAILLSTTCISGCATENLPAIQYDNTPKQAVVVPNPPKPIQIVEIPKPLPLPDQLKPLPGQTETVAERRDPHARVADANNAARIQPTHANYINAIQVYPFSDGALYEIYASPGDVTDVALEMGEHLVGTGPVAAGDTVRWVIGSTESGTASSKRTHILLKPSQAGLTTNLVINTDRRTYHLELRSVSKTYMAAVSFSYPQDELIALHAQNQTAAAADPVSVGIDVESLTFRYAINGDNPPWRPLRAFDDGRQVFVEFPSGIAQGEMPPLWVIGPQGEGQLVNYRVRGNYMIVDRLFAAAELRLGADPQLIVRIARTDGKKRS